jgi:homoaconitase/3-isopropylmalate dehydratase large subunit
MSIFQQMKTIGKTSDDIRKIRIRTHEAAIRIIDKKGPLANPADRDHCIQYMVAVPLIFGRLTAADYEDDIAKDPRIDSLRKKIECVEDKRFTRDYHDPKKRSIANALTVEFKDGSKLKEVVCEYPIGHKRRRAEGMPILVEKFKTNLARRFSDKQQKSHSRRLHGPGQARGDARQRVRRPVRGLISGVIMDSFNTLQSFKNGKLYSLPALGKKLNVKVERLPVSIRIVLESVLRNCDGKKVTEAHVRELASWKPNAKRTEEIPFVLARILLQDFTGVPLLCDLAAMRSVAQKMGKNPKTIEPLVPVDLVVDHSVQIDHYGNKNALDLNMKLEFKRNEERYQFMKWGMQAFDTFKVVPPGIGIVHQVNLEYLARGVHKSKDGVCYPDTLVGTDSHTTMINGIGVVAWGVGGIEAEAGMLGQPVYFLTPDVVGVNVKGKLHPACTATDLVLTVTEMLRKAKVVGKFVEFFGEGAASLAATDRATLGNMAPEYGATMGFFPVDDRTVEYFRGTGRTDEEIERFVAYFKAQGMYGMPKAGDIDYSQVLELDLSTIYPSLAGPKRPQDRIDLDKVKGHVRAAVYRPGEGERVSARRPTTCAGRTRPSTAWRSRTATC